MANISQIKLPTGNTYDIKDNISGYITDAGVTGIKGNAESSYRTGQVNLTAGNIGAVAKSGDTMTGQLKTSFRSSVAMGSYQANSNTIPDLCEELRYSSGCCGSVNITTAYDADVGAVSTGWYTFIWIPHRSGGVNGVASGDNCNYGTMFLNPMNDANVFGTSWIINYINTSTTQQIKVTKLAKDFDLSLKASLVANTNIPADSDLNDTKFLKTGSYAMTLSANAPTIVNKPSDLNAAFMMNVYSPLSGASTAFSIEGNQLYRVQEITSYMGLQRWVRMCSTDGSGNWGYQAWTKLYPVTDLSIATGTLAIANGGTGSTTANTAANTLLTGLPVWTADPTDDTYMIRQDTSGTNSFGKVKVSTFWNYISGKLPSWSKASTKPTYTASEVGALATSTRGAANGVAPLNASSKIDSTYLPSYVDDVLEYNGTTNFPSTGEAGKIYVDTSTNKTYRWGGSSYTEISQGSIVSVSRSLTSGTKSATITVNGTGYDIYSTNNDDTKNTAGSTDSSSKLFLIGATSQAANPQTYSHDTAYVGTNGHLYSGSKEVLVGGSNAASSVTITPTTTDVYSMTSAGSVTAGTAPSFTRGTFSAGTLPSLTFAMDTTDTKQLNITFSQGTLPSHAADSFSAGTTPSVVTLPGRSSVIKAWTGYSAATAAAQTFTGTTS